jgi:hypothetical protein
MPKFLAEGRTRFDHVDTADGAITVTPSSIGPAGYALTAP